MDLSLIFQWLGHAHLQTTLIYTYADTEQKRKTIEQCNLTEELLSTHLDANRHIISDDEMLKRLYGLK